MNLDASEMQLFASACLDQENMHAQELLNVFAVDQATDVLWHLNHAPLGVLADLISHLYRAMEHEAVRRATLWPDDIDFSF